MKNRFTKGRAEPVPVEELRGGGGTKEEGGTVTEEEGGARDGRR